MRLTTWSGSVIETKDYGASVWWRWALGWVRRWWWLARLHYHRRRRRWRVSHFVFPESAVSKAGPLPKNRS